MAFVHRTWTIVVIVLATIAAEFAMAGRQKISIVEGDPQKVGGHQAGHFGHGGHHTNHNARYGGTHQYGGGGGSSASEKSCPKGQVLKVEWRAGDNGDGKLYANSYAGGVFSVHAGDRFEYEIMWKDHDCNCSVDFESGVDYRLRDHGPKDALDYSPHAEKNFNMSQVAFGKWYKRSWDLPADLVGKYIDKWVFSAALPKNSQRVAYFRYIRVVDEDGETRRAVFEDGSEPPIANSYMSGSVETSCQPLAELDVDVRLHEDVVASGTRSILSGEISSKMIVSPGGGGGGTSIVDHRGLCYARPSYASNSKAVRAQQKKKEKEQGSSKKSDSDADQKESKEEDEGEMKETGADLDLETSLAPMVPFEELRRRLPVMDQSLFIHSIDVSVRHREAKDVVLWNVFHRTFTVPEPTPLPLWIVLPVPEQNAMSHLINSSKLVLKIRFSNPSGGAENPPVEESVLSAPMALHPGSNSFPDASK